jgi:hypothetical protein
VLAFDLLDVPGDFCHLMEERVEPEGGAGHSPVDRSTKILDDIEGLKCINNAESFSLRNLVLLTWSKLYCCQQKKKRKLTF